MAEDAKRDVLKDIVVPLIATAVSAVAALFAYQASEHGRQLEEDIAEVGHRQNARQINLNFYVGISDIIRDAVTNDDAKSAELARLFVNQIDDDDEVKASFLKMLEQAEGEVGQKASADLAVVNAAAAQPEDVAPAGGIDLRGWRTQVLYCEANFDASLPFAETIATRMIELTGAESRLTSVRPGAEARYSNARFNVNYPGGDASKRAIANQLAELLSESAPAPPNGAVAFTPRAVARDRGNFLSVYVCPEG